MSAPAPGHLTGQALATWAAGDPREAMWIERVATGLVEWFRRGEGPIAFQTARVLFLATMPQDPPTAADLERIAGDYARTHPRSAGADPLTRIPGLAAAVSSLAIDDRDLAAAAMQACRLTHVDPEVVQACALWVIRMRHADAAAPPEAVVDRALRALAATGASSQTCDRWAGRLEIARRPDPPPDGGYAVTCLLRAWWAAEPGRTDDLPPTDLTAGLVRAIRRAAAR